MRPLFWLAVVTAVVAGACSSGSTEIDARIDEPITSVEVRVGDGDVTVERASGRPEWVATADFSGERPAFEPTVVNGVLIVSDGCAEGAECSVIYTIRVPEATPITAVSGAGSVTITEIEGDVSVETESGTIFLNTVRGTIDVETVSGDIVGTRLVSSSATFDVDQSGNIDVAFEAEIANLVVETGSGNITAQLVDGSYNLDGQTDSGSIDFKIDDDDSATNTVTLRTGSGDLTVYKQ